LAALSIIALFFSAGVLGSFGNELFPQDRSTGRQKRIRNLCIEVKKIGLAI